MIRFPVPVVDTVFGLVDFILFYFFKHMYIYIFIYIFCLRSWYGFNPPF